MVHLAAGSLFVATVAGCGGSAGMMGGQGGMMGGGSTGTGTNAGTGSGGGRALFVASCGGCHRLAAAGTSGTAGPNLDEARPSYDHVLQLVTNGEGAMPAFIGRLTRSQIQSIARYVANAAR